MSINGPTGCRITLWIKQLRKLRPLKKLYTVWWHTDSIEVPVHAVHSKDSATEVEQLRRMLERMLQKFESFEQQLTELDPAR